jgi:hypothetical protein
VEDRTEATDSSRTSVETPSRDREARPEGREQQLLSTARQKVRKTIRRVRSSFVSLMKSWPVIASIAGAVLYIIGRFFADAFYGKYGLTSEDVGINLPYLALRVLPLAALLGAGIVVLTGVGLILGPIINWVLVSLYRILARGLNRLTTWRDLVLSVVVLALLAGGGVWLLYRKYISPLPHEAELALRWMACLGGGVGMLLGASITLWRRFESEEEKPPKSEEEKPPKSEGKKPDKRLPTGGWVLVGIIGFYLVIFGANGLMMLPFDTADEYAHRLAAGQPVKLAVGRWPLFQVDPFRIERVDGEESLVAGQCVFLLGTSGSTTFLYDPAAAGRADRVWRLPSGSVRLSRSPTEECR